MKKQNVLLSIIIPVYNLENYIEDCLDSLVKQITENVEIIIVNDGSIDKSEIICKKYCSEYPYIKYVYQENAGVSSARNNGLDSSVGQYIQFVDGDDCLLPNSIPNILNKIELNNPDIIVGDYVKFYNKIDSIKEPNVDIKIISNIENSNYPNNIITLTNYNLFNSSLWCNVFKSDIIKKNNIKFIKTIKYTEDLDFCLQAFFYCKKVNVLRDKMYAYRQSRNGSATSIVSEKRIIDNLDFVKKWYDFYKNVTIDEQIKNYLINFIAYEYSIVYGLLFLTDKTTFSRMYSKVYEYKWLLKYKQNKKVKLVSMMYHIIGFKNTGKLLARFIKTKNR